MFQVNNKQARTMSSVSLFLAFLLALCILVSVLSTLNIFHMLLNVKNAEICALYWKKERKKSKFDRLHVEVFFLLNISPPIPSPEYKPVKFVLCPYISPGILTGFYSMLCCNFDVNTWIFNDNFKFFMALEHPVQM